MDRLQAVCAAVVDLGETWISTTRLTGIGPVLRACITSFETQPEDVRTLVEALNAARERVSEA